MNLLNLKRQLLPNPGLSMPSYGGGGEGGGDGVSGGATSGGYGTGGYSNSSSDSSSSGWGTSIAGFAGSTIGKLAGTALGGPFGGYLGGLAGGYLGRSAASGGLSSSGSSEGTASSSGGSMTTGQSGDNSTAYNFTSNSLGSTLGSALGGLIAGGGSSGNSNSIADTADPFRSQRPQYQQMLQQLMTDPSSFKQSAGSLSATQSGMSAIDAQMAAKGIGRSGAETSALTGYATDQASKDYYQQLSALMQMSGVNSGSPATAAQAQQTGQSNQIAGLGALGSQLGSAVSNWWDNLPTSPTDMTGFVTPGDAISYPSIEDPSSALGSGGFSFPDDPGNGLSDFFLL